MSTTLGAMREPLHKPEYVEVSKMTQPIALNGYCSVSNVSSCKLAQHGDSCTSSPPSLCLAPDIQSHWQG